MQCAENQVGALRSFEVLSLVLLDDNNGGDNQHGSSERADKHKHLKNHFCVAFNPRTRCDGGGLPEALEGAIDRRRPVLTTTDRVCMGGSPRIRVA